MQQSRNEQFIAELKAKQEWRKARRSTVPLLPPRPPTIDNSYYDRVPVHNRCEYCLITYTMEPVVEEHRCHFCWNKQPICFRCRTILDGIGHHVCEACAFCYGTIPSRIARYLPQFYYDYYDGDLPSVVSVTPPRPMPKIVSYHQDVQQELKEAVEEIKDEIKENKEEVKEEVKEEAKNEPIPEQPSSWLGMFRLWH